MNDPEANGGGEPDLTFNGIDRVLLRGRLIAQIEEQGGEVDFTIIDGVFFDAVGEWKEADEIFDDLLELAGDLGLDLDSMMEDLLYPDDLLDEIDDDEV
jgi:hypothetical protein